MVYCPSCGSEVATDAKFCSSCGEDVADLVTGLGDDPSTGASPTATGDDAPAETTPPTSATSEAQTGAAPAPAQSPPSGQPAEPSTSRRNVLKLGVAAGAVGAGFFAYTRIFGGNGRYVDWVPEEAFDDEWGAHITATKPSELASIEDSWMSADGDIYSLPVSSIDRLIEHPGALVLQGDFTSEEVHEGETTTIGSHAGYELHEDGGEVAAIRDGETVISGDRERVERSIDAANGDHTRLIEVYEPFEQVIAAVGTSGNYCDAGMRPDQNQRASALNVDLAPTTSSGDWAFYFDSSVDEEYADLEDEVRDFATDYSIDRDGQLVVLSMEFPTDEF